VSGYDLIEYWIARLYCFFFMKKFGCFIDSTILDKKFNPLYFFLKLVFLFKIHVVLCYGYLSKKFAIFLNVPKNRIVIRCQTAGFSKRYNPKAILEARLKSKKIASKVFQLLYVGRISPEKGLWTLIDALKNISATNFVFKLNIIGAGPSLDSLMKYVAENKMTRNIKFLGPKNKHQLSRYYMRSDLFVLPSLSEPWGLVINEAFAFGCPAIVSNKVGCYPELINKNVTGLIFEAGNANDLSNKLIIAFKLFNKNLSTAEACIRKISKFTDESAALNILKGIKLAFKDNLR
jgi:glycosyltransferase involved in cell wall biosynthesis